MKLPVSFSVDHTRMEAPAVRKAATVTGPQGDIVTKFDLRFVRPNEDAIPTGGMHTLEHCLGAFMRDNLDGIIDISPMGCRTGFYLVCFGEPDEEEIRQAVSRSLREILSLEIEDVPGVSERQCGNWRDHSLYTAQKYAGQIIKGWGK